MGVGNSNDYLHGDISHGTPVCDSEKPKPDL